LTSAPANPAYEQQAATLIPASLKESATFALPQQLATPAAMRRHFPIRRDEVALDKVILTAQLQPLLSNAKWVKVIGTLVANWQLIHLCKVKLIWEDATVERRLVIEEETSYDFDYYATAMEAMITGTPRLGWAAYKEIEWLDFPRFLPDQAHAQDVAAIEQQLAVVGQFRLEVSADNLRLYAYHRP
jgi:hypothetical protein